MMSCKKKLVQVKVDGIWWRKYYVFFYIEENIMFGSLSTRSKIQQKKKQSVKIYGVVEVGEGLRVCQEWTFFS